jgi:rod shape-determining protein MreD
VNDLSTNVSREIGAAGACEERRILPAGLANVHGGAAISYIGPLLAVIVGIVHAAISPVIVIGDVKPNLVLIAVVLVTCLGGFGPGILFAFVAGLTANLLVSDPLGSIPLALLIVAALTAGGSRVLGQAIWVYPILAVAVGSVVADLVMLGLGQLVGDARLAELPTQLILAAAALNAVVGAILLVPARMVAARYATDEATAW